MTSSAGGQPVECRIDPAFTHLLGELGGSLLITTYQANKVIAVSSDGLRLNLLMRDFEKPMGLAVQGSTWALGTREDIVLLENAPYLAPEYKLDRPDKYDALFLPRVTYHTGDVAVHDLAFDSSGAVWFANTRFSCVSRLNMRFSFEPMWKPPFVSQIAPGDRCHLNGLAMVDGRAAYVTCLGETDEAGGWRGGKATGGCVVDIGSNEVILRGLAMPHSPRWHGGRLWILNSAAGELLVLDRNTGRVTVAGALPAYVRGLDFAGAYALVGMSKIREARTFGDLPVQSRFDQLLCGVAAVNLGSGTVEGMLEFTEGVSDLFEVRFLPGVRKPTVLNREREEFRYAFTAPQFSYWIRDQKVAPARCG
jgi:uncharacterized protein (TIGR03032 family)